MMLQLKQHKFLLKLLTTYITYDDNFLVPKYKISNIPNLSFTEEKRYKMKMVNSICLASFLSWSLFLLLAPVIDYGFKLHQFSHLLS